MDAAAAALLCRPRLPLSLRMLPPGATFPTGVLSSSSSSSASPLASIMAFVALPPCTSATDTMGEAFAAATTVEGDDRLTVGVEGAVSVLSGKTLSPQFLFHSYAVQCALVDLSASPRWRMRSWSWAPPGSCPPRQRRSSACCPRPRPCWRSPRSPRTASAPKEGGQSSLLLSCQVYVQERIVISQAMKYLYYIESSLFDP